MGWCRSIISKVCDAAECRFSSGGHSPRGLSLGSIAVCSIDYIGRMTAWEFHFYLIARDSPSPDFNDESCKTPALLLPVVHEIQLKLGTM